MGESREKNEKKTHHNKPSRGELTISRPTLSSPAAEPPSGSGQKFCPACHGPVCFEALATGHVRHYIWYGVF